MAHGGDHPREPIQLSVSNGNGNGQAQKILWWIVNVLLGIGTTVLTILYMSLQERMTAQDQHIAALEQMFAIRGERIRALEVRMETLSQRRGR